MAVESHAHAYCLRVTVRAGDLVRETQVVHRHDDRSELPDADHIVDSHAELEKLLGFASRAATEADD
jgi:hypothetical protein